MGSLTSLDSWFGGHKEARARRGPRIGRPGKPLAQVRGVVAERVVLSTELDPYLSLKALSRYSGLSVRKLRDLLTDPAHPLPHYRLGGKILVRRSEYDAWMVRHRQLGNPDLDHIAAEAVREVRAGASPSCRVRQRLDTAKRLGVSVSHAKTTETGQAR